MYHINSQSYSTVNNDLFSYLQMYKYDFATITLQLHKEHQATERKKQKMGRSKSLHADTGR
jgi:hypothetical protein